MRVAGMVASDRIHAHVSPPRPPHTLKVIHRGCLEFVAYCLLAAFCWLLSGCWLLAASAEQVQHWGHVLQLNR